MIQEPKIKFYLNQYKIKGDKHPVYLRLTFGRKKAEVFIGHSLEKKEWDEKKQRAKKNFHTNQKINEIEGEVYEITRRLAKADKPISANAIKNLLNQKDKLDFSILEFYNSYLDWRFRAKCTTYSAVK